MPRINKYSALMFTLLIYMISPISAKRIEAMLDKFKVQRNTTQSDETNLQISLAYVAGKSNITGMPKLKLY